MNTLVTSLAVMATIVVLHQGDGALIRPESVDESSRMLRSLNSAGDKIGSPEKRFASQYFTNLRAKHYDKAALQRFLQHSYMGKRSPFDGDVEGVRGFSDVGNPKLFSSGFVALFAPLDGDVIKSILSSVDGDVGNSLHQE